MVSIKYTKQRELASLFNGCRDRRVQDAGISWGKTCLGGKGSEGHFCQARLHSGKSLFDLADSDAAGFSFCCSLPFNVSRMVLTAPYSLPQVEEEKLIDADKVRQLLLLLLPPSGETGNNKDV